MSSIKYIIFFTFEELGLVRVHKDLLALLDQLLDHVALGLQLGQGLLLTLDQLVHVLDAAGSNVSGGGEHDTVKELNMGLELVTVGVTLPVQVNHHLGTGYNGSPTFTKEFVNII